MQTLILAAGEGNRWDGPSIKQLMPISGQPLICRTIEQVQARGQLPYVVSHRQDLQTLHQLYFQPPARTWITETLLATQSLWDERVITLLGDVIYSSAAIEAIYGNSQVVAVFGRPWEIFAVVFEPSDKIITALEAAITNRANDDRHKLWEFYRAYCGLPIESYNSLEDEVFIMIDDYTNDIDTWQEYGIFLRENPWAL